MEFFDTVGPSIQFRHCGTKYLFSTLWIRTPATVSLFNSRAMERAIINYSYTDEANEY